MFALFPLFVYDVIGILVIPLLAGGASWKLTAEILRPFIAKWPMDAETLGVIVGCVIFCLAVRIGLATPHLRSNLVEMVGFAARHVFVLGTAFMVWGVAIGVTNVLPFLAPESSAVMTTLLFFFAYCWFAARVFANDPLSLTRPPDETLRGKGLERGDDVAKQSFDQF